MRVGAIPDNVIERFALASGLVPLPLVDSWFTFMLARTIMVGTKVGLFEALDAGPLTATEIATRCHTNPSATGKLLNALVGTKYLRAKEGRYALAPVARRWLLQSNPSSVRDAVLFRCMEWEWWSRCEEFVRTGVPLRVHETMTDEEWGVYQRGMRSGIEMMAKMVARKLPIPNGATKMLDIGGSHGHWSAAICRRHSKLRATILELESAVKHAEPILAREGMGDRIAHRVGNALTDDLGESAYDVVFMAALVHHFDDATNRSLMTRIARALRPHGIVAVWEPERQDANRGINQIGGLLDLGFAMYSESGTWSAAEIAEWQRAAGLTPLKPIRILLSKDLLLQVARKTAASTRLSRGVANGGSA